MALPSLQEAARLALLNPLQRDILERSVTNNKRALRRMSAEFDGSTNERMWDDADDMAPDPGDIRDSLARDQGMLNKYDPKAYAEKMKPYDIQKAWQWVQMLTEEIRQGMPSDDQMEKPTAQNIDLHLRWTDRVLNGRHPKYPGMNLVGARSTLIRLLDPDNDDPHLTSVERIRPRDDAHVDWKTYYSRFDEIQFALQDKVEEALEELDEDRFNRFCQLKAADWTKKNIQKDLSFDDAMFEAAMVRLRALRDAMVSHEEEREASHAPHATPPERAQHDTELTDESEAAARQAMGASMKKALKDRNISQTIVAEKLGVKAGSFVNILSGHTAAKPTLVLKFQALMAAYDADHSLLPTKKPPFQKKEEG